MLGGTALTPMLLPWLLLINVANSVSKNKHLHITDDWEIKQQIDNTLGLYQNNSFIVG